MNKLSNQSILILRTLSEKKEPVLIEFNNDLSKNRCVLSKSEEVLALRDPEHLMNDLRDMLSYGYLKNERETDNYYITNKGKQFILTIKN